MLTKKKTFFHVVDLQVDPVVYNMLQEDPGNVSYSSVGGLSDQIRDLRESIELPLMNPELFLRVGINLPRVFFSMDLQEQERHCWLEQLPAI